MKYLSRRIVTLFLTLFLVSILTFTAFNLIPGDPVILILGTETTPQRADMLRSQLGLDRPMPVRYVEWLMGLVQGNFGNSIKYSLPVKSLIEGRLPTTISLALLAIFLIVIIAIPVGIYCARKRNMAIDKVLNSVSMLNLAVPNFFLGVLFIWVFGLQLKFFTPGNYVDYNENFVGFIGYLLFPALVIALPNIAILVKFLRTAVINQLTADYVRTAYSKGVSDNKVISHHVLKNALPPVITLLGMIIAEIFSGSIIIEQVFSLPGIGRLLISSISFRDFPLIQTLVVYIAFIVVFVNFLVDVLLQAIDPRIRVR
ncbi:MAG: ABC transporter permease [Chloroflexi bacterium]|uniref:ABC transporter permease n=1 Tax=Candidatus Chlorohelix allophototropha TaxID=3003348 RepID=A0A8T7M480_9CHLR|nr:ABC transporter permease [Chloroflexota bacterium]